MRRAGEPEVSLFLPTFNAGREFPEILALMLDQELDRPYEVIAIDSGSRDGTVEFLERQPVRLYRIPNAEFDHGLTRNRGVELARGGVVVMATQDARPANREWMQRLVDCFDDPEVVGAFSRQIPRPDANPLIRDRLSSWVAGTSEKVVSQVKSEAEFWALAPMQRLKVAAFDNVSSAVRRSTMALHPFHQRPFGEDIDWSRRVILAGHKLVFEPRSAVIHSHNRSAWAELKRIYGDHHNLHDALGVHTIPTWAELREYTAMQTRHYRGVVAADERLSPAEKRTWTRRAAHYAWAENLGQYLGARSVAKLRERRLAYRALDRLLRRGV